MSRRHTTGWDSIYHRYPPESLPWELGKPRKILVELLESKQLPTGKALDLCCGAGSNTVYMAEKGFDVTALDISDKAVEHAKEKALKTGVNINFIIASFLRLPFRTERFDFAFDFGCFHHVEIKERTAYIKDVHRVLKPKSLYLLVCFSYKNGPGWNHFTREQIQGLSEDYFQIEWIKHVSSIESDNVRRYFFEALMKNLVNT